MINWKILRILLVAIFCSMLGLGIATPLLPAYAHELGATEMDIGFIFGAFSISLSLFLPIVGRLSDVRGRKPFIVSGLLVYVVTSVAYILLKDMHALILIRFSQGIAAALLVAAEAYTGDIAPKGKEGLMMGFLNASLAAGLCAGPLTGGAAKDLFGIKAAFLIMGLVCLFAFFICAIFLPHRKEELVFTKDKPSVTYREFLSDRNIAGLFLFRLAYSMCIGAIWAFGPLIADTEYNMSGLAIGVFLTLGIFISAVLMVPMGFLADRFSKRFLMSAGGVIIAYAMLFFCSINEGWEFYIASILFGVGGGLSLPSVMGMAVVLGREKESMGTVVSLLILGETMGLALGSIIAGIVIHTFSIKAAFTGAAAMILATTVITLFLTSGSGMHR